MKSINDLNVELSGFRSEMKEFKKAMAFMDSFVIDDLAYEIPADEDGRGAIARVKYEL